MAISDRVSDLSMSDYEPRSHSNQPSHPSLVATGARPNTRKHAAVAAALQPDAPPTKPKKGWGQRLKDRLFGGRKKRGHMERAASSSRLVQRRKQPQLQSRSRSVSASAFTHSNPPLYPTTDVAEPQSYAGTPSSRSHFSHSHQPAAYHGSYYNGGATTSAMSMSARDFRQPMNSYAYAREDESYTNLANQQIDEDLEVSYFNP